MQKFTICHQKLYQLRFDFSEVLGVKLKISCYKGGASAKLFFHHSSLVFCLREAQRL